MINNTSSLLFYMSRAPIQFLRRKTAIARQYGKTSTSPPIHTGPNAVYQAAIARPAHNWQEVALRRLTDLCKLIHNLILFMLTMVGALALILATFPHGRLLMYVHLPPPSSMAIPIPTFASN